jgi:chromatin structure-remodeling complex subunit RSC1/2
MDVDVSGMTPEPNGQGDDVGMGVGMERDRESEIVRQLEKGLRRWQGFGEKGWMEEVNPVSLAVRLNECELNSASGSISRDCTCY